MVAARCRQRFGGPPRHRLGIALPVVLLVLVALGLLSAMALSDALRAARVAALAEDAVLARAALIGAVAELAEPPELSWLCLQPPSVAQARATAPPGGGRLVWRWRVVRPGVLRVELEATGPGGARHRRIGWMRPDSLVPLDPRPGCPDASRLEPLRDDWLGAHPEG